MLVRKLEAVMPHLHGFHVFFMIRLVEIVSVACFSKVQAKSVSSSSQEMPTVAYHVT